MRTPKSLRTEPGRGTRQSCRSRCGIQVPELHMGGVAVDARDTVFGIGSRQRFLAHLVRLDGAAHSSGFRRVAAWPVNEAGPNPPIRAAATDRMWPAPPGTRSRKEIRHGGGWTMTGDLSNPSSTASATAPCQSIAANTATAGSLFTADRLLSLATRSLRRDSSSLITADQIVTRANALPDRSPKGAVLGRRRRSMVALERRGAVSRCSGCNVSGDSEVPSPEGIVLRHCVANNEHSVV
jgi:hypothetical protein